jgi:hypothetical protein
MVQQFIDLRARVLATLSYYLRLAEGRAWAEAFA